MALHAVQRIDSAFTATKEFLTPLDVRRWGKLALIALFVGGGLNVPSVQFNTAGPSEQISGGELPFTVPTETVTLIVALGVAGVILGAIFALIGAIMEFVFVESLRTGDVSIRQYWSERWRQGLRLFGFRIVIGIPAVAVFVGWLALLVLPVVSGRNPTIPVTAFLLGIPVLVVIGLLHGLVSGFTTVFVVPLMIQRDSGVVAGWRRLWGSITTEWKQYLAYAVLAFLLTIAAGLLASIVLGVAAFVLFVPIAIGGGITYVTASFSSTVGFAVLIGLVLLFGVVMTAVWAVVQVPVVTYLRYYALLVLGDIDESFDIISEQRTAIEE